MEIDISKLRKDRVFESEKIKISFSTGDISNQLCVYLIDENGEHHHVLWQISNDRCLQSFNKANLKIILFVQEKINEWIKEEEEAERLRKKLIQKRDSERENKLRKLIDSF